MEEWEDGGKEEREKGGWRQEAPLGPFVML